MIGMAMFTSGSKMALTRKGMQKAIKQYCEIEGYPNGVTKSKISLVNMYEHLIERGEASTDGLLHFFEPVDHHHNPSTGRYGSYHEDQWWDDVGRPQLANLPGVELINENEGRWEFLGVKPAEFDDEHLVPLEELRSDPTVRVRNALHDLGVVPQTEEHEGLLSLWEFLSTKESATTDRLDRWLRTVDVDVEDLTVADIESDLEALPGIERIVNGPPNPSEIEVSTMQDVIEGYDLLDQETTIEWRYTPVDEA